LQVSYRVLVVHKGKRNNILFSTASGLFVYMRRFIAQLMPTVFTNSEL